MNDKIKIRQETQADNADIFEINRAAFDQDDEAKLVDALRTNTSAFIPELSLVAKVGETIVGHILFSNITIADKDGIMHKSLALAPMAVRPEWQNLGIGGRLIRHGFDVAKNLGFKSVIVLGHPGYYPKFGFEPAEKWQIKAPFDVPPEAFMAIELMPDGLHNVSGIVRYPKEFETV